MALSGAMGSGISGLKAFMNALNVVGNNVANVNTYGYKAGRVTFKESIYNTQSVGSAGSDVLGGTNPNQIGYGTTVGTIDLDMSTQGLESTGRTEDCAIVGDGFFLLGDKNGVDTDNLNTLSLSRVGDFKIDDDGYLTDGAGNIVYGFVTCSNSGATPGTTPSNTVSTQLVPLRLPVADDDGKCRISWCEWWRKCSSCWFYRCYQLHQFTDRYQWADYLHQRNDKGTRSSRIHRFGYGYQSRRLDQERWPLL